MYVVDAMHIHCRCQRRVMYLNSRDAISHYYFSPHRVHRRRLRGCKDSGREHCPVSRARGTEQKLQYVGITPRRTVFLRLFLLAALISFATRVSAQHPTGLATLLASTDAIDQETNQ